MSTGFDLKSSMSTADLLGAGADMEEDPYEDELYGDRDAIPSEDDEDLDATAYADGDADAPMMPPKRDLGPIDTTPNFHVSKVLQKSALRSML